MNEVDIFEAERLAKEHADDELKLAFPEGQKQSVEARNFWVCVFHRRFLQYVQKPEWMK